MLFYDLAFHPNGSLAFSGSFDSYVRGLRAERCIMFLEGRLLDLVITNAKLGISE